MQVEWASLQWRIGQNPCGEWEVGLRGRLIVTSLGLSTHENGEGKTGEELELKGRE